MTSEGEGPTIPAGESMSGTNPDRPGLLTNATLCGAKTRAGSSCRCPALRGKSRCQRHGGRSTGVSGERNGAWKGGHYTNEALALRQAASRLLREIADASA